MQVGLGMVAGGYALSMYCTSQLGVDGTYFGIELGMVQVRASCSRSSAAAAAAAAARARERNKQHRYR